MNSESVEDPRRLPKTDRLIGAAVLLAATLLCYLPALRGDFIWDDDRHVSQNQTLRSTRGLMDIWMRRGATVQYYPLTHTSFWIEYRLWGLNRTGYHLTNVLLHGVNAVLVWELLRRLQFPGAFLAGAIFALHPVEVESVAWITERKNLLATCLGLLSMLAYLRGNTRGYILSFLLFGGALFSKTIVCSMPAVMLLLLWWQNRLTRRRVLILLPFFALGILMGVGTAQMEASYVGASGADWQLSFAQRLLIAARAVWFYAGKLICPVNLMFSYPRWEIDPANPVHYIPLVALMAVIAFLALSVRQLGRGPLVAVLIYIGTLFPALGFIDVYPMRYSFVADHFQYMSSIALIALIAAGMTVAWHRWLIRPRVDAIRLRFALANSGLLLGILGVLTWRQARVYVNSETLWSDTIRKNPASWMARNNLGAVLSASASGDLESGRREDAHGKLARAITLFEEVERARPGHLKARLGRARALDMLQRYDLSVPLYEQVVEEMKQQLARARTDAETRISLGYVLGRLERVDEARLQLEEALRLQPESISAREGLEMLQRMRSAPGSRPNK